MYVVRSQRNTSNLIGLECYLESKLEPELWDRVKDSTQDSRSFTFDRYKQRQRKKFDNLVIQCVQLN